MNSSNIKRLGLILIVVALLITAIGTVLAADQTVVIDFSKYTVGTPADAISEPGVTFTVTEGTAEITQNYLLLNEVSISNFDPTSVTMMLAQEANSISFEYLTGGNCGYPINEINLYLKGIQVDNLVINSCDDGTYSRNMVFDEVRFTAGRVTNTEAVLIGNITLTRSLTKKTCKKGGWQALGYQNQGECTKAAK